MYCLIGNKQNKKNLFYLTEHFKYKSFLFKRKSKLLYKIRMFSK